MAATTEPLRHEVRIDAPPEVVFPYFTDPARYVQWMGTRADLEPLADVVLDSVGGLLAG